MSITRIALATSFIFIGALHANASASISVATNACVNYFAMSFCVSNAVNHAKIRNPIVIARENRNAIRCAKCSRQGAVRGRSGSK